MHWSIECLYVFFRVWCVCMCVCVCACVHVLVCLERVVKKNVRRTEYHTRGRMWSMCVIFGTPSEKWYARTKNDTTLQTVCCSTFFGFSCLFAGKTVRRPFTWYAAYAFKTDDRTVSKRTRYVFWYAVRISVRILCTVYRRTQSP